ncbi:putative adhesin [Streptomyces albidus (ex Kaewkla and Franco 2022)]|uniref:putative adhesin n=1 Tax=Streptomyces albidus (ex Kaewkla and Franco 2022) TaxID=722709 RepID=UPI0015EFA2DA|nr:hypothetical protein [Streptomyces albidus (ex Kaewkla and Franco 2022)]
MDPFEQAKRFMIDAFGMWWPDAEVGQLREAADAWRNFADVVGDARQATNPKAGSVIHHNNGIAIEAFENFWGRYHRADLSGTASAGWLDDLERAALSMAKALAEFACDVGEAKNKITTELEIHAPTIVEGISSGTLTSERASGHAGAAARTLVEFAARMRQAVSMGAARIDATVFSDVAFAGVESITAETAVAEAMRPQLRHQAGTSERGAETARPSEAEIKEALKQTGPRYLPEGNWPSGDGRSFANRVLEGGRPDGETVFAGHGYLREGAGTATVPPGTTLDFYVMEGEKLPGLHGLSVERGVYPGPAVESFGPGDEVPNYTLAPPQSASKQFCVYENSTTVAAPATVSDLLRPGMGNVHWAACR